MYSQFNTLQMTTNLREYSEVKQRVEHGIKILRSYSWLLDSFVLDFYIEKHWEKLPVKWRHLLDTVELDELGCLLDYRNANPSLKRVWPLSFLALRSAAHMLSVSRKQAESLNALFHKSNAHFEPTDNLHQSSSNQIKLDNISAGSMEDQILGNEFIINPKYSHIFMKHVKPKKRHEVALMAKITAETAKSTGCSYVVDVGSGLGHLARMLAYGYDLQVCCLEAQHTLAQQARKLDLELEVTMTKYISNDQSLDFCRPVHVSNTLNSSVDENYFVQVLKTAFGMENTDINFGIVGLHPCGDLGPLLLHLFIKCPNARFINIVGCCYMKLSTSEQNNVVNFQGYPLSNFISEQPCSLSYEAREIACHAIENYCERLCSGNVSHLKVHCYRATLERLLVKFWPNLRHSGIRSIRHSNELPFDKYCHAATERLGVVLPEEEINSKETRDDLSQWKRVVIFYSLRLLLAPLVETVLLFDRLFYLLELGLNGTLIPVFDPCLSPRNHILIATKQINK
ncbi:Uncharacterized protein GBIM_11531 [Gryllus bimaculatus]|nr:Uncharacterized protein GBIM_11531 [Gryllus bimaculatus]